jgi:hypothetical protein
MMRSCSRVRADSESTIVKDKIRGDLWLGARLCLDTESCLDAPQRQQSLRDGPAIGDGSWSE